MKGYKTLKRIVWVVTACILAYFTAVSCSEEADCSMTARPMLNANIYTIDVESGLAIRDTLDILTITAAGTDSVILNNEENVISLSLPLRYAVDSTVLVFHYLLIHNLLSSSLRSCMQFLISLLTFEQSHCFLPSLWDSIQYQHLINYCPPIFSESSFLKHNQAFDNN